MATKLSLSDEKKKAVFNFAYFLFQLYASDCTNYEQQQKLANHLFEFCMTWHGYSRRGTFNTEFDHWMMFEIKCDRAKKALQGEPDINTYILRFARELVGLERGVIKEIYNQLKELNARFGQVLPPDKETQGLQNSVMLILLYNLNQMGVVNL